MPEGMGILGCQRSEAGILAEAASPALRLLQILTDELPKSENGVGMAA